MNKTAFLALTVFGTAMLLFFGHGFMRKQRKVHDLGSSIKLRFNDKHEFTLLQITDLHYGEGETLDALNDQVHEKILHYVKPDAVVITGDAISGCEWNKRDKDWFAGLWKRFTSVYERLKIPYAYALGNHDREGDASLGDISKLEQSHPYSLFDGNQEIDPLSLTNYLVHLYSNFEGHYDKISALLWILDSKKGCGSDYHGGNGCINDAQLKWYEDMSAKHLDAAGNKIKGMSFFHVPIQEFMTVWNQEKTYGFKDEYVCCPPINTNVFTTFLKTGNMKAVVCGHDHNNNYGGTLQGIDLIYGQKTGYGSYGPSKTQRGGRVFKFTEKLSPEGVISWSYVTYSVYEDGTVEYPEEPHWQGKEKYQTKCDL